MGQARLSSRQYADSLLQNLQVSPTDSQRALTSFRLAEHWVLLDTARAARFLEQGRAASLRYPVVRAMYHYYAAYMLSVTDPVKAQQAYLLADSLLTPFTGEEALRIRSKTLHRYGALRQQYDDPKQFADIMLNKAIPLARLAGDSGLISKNYLGIGHVFRNNGQFAVAEQYMQAALQVARNGHAPLEQLVVNYLALAENHSLAGKNAQAAPLLDTVRALLAPYPHSDFWLDYYAAESLHYNEAHEYAKALAGLQKGIPLARTLGKRYEEQRLQLQRFYALYGVKDYRQSLQVLDYLLEQPEMTRYAVNRLLLYTGMADTYAAQGNTSQAYLWQKKYSALSDSVNATRLTQEISALEIKFRNAENEQKITRLEAEHQKAVLTASNTRLTVWLLTAASCLLIAVTLFTVLYYRYNKKLSQQQEINYRQQLTVHAMIEGEERERSRVARDLHDGLGGMLAGVKIKLSGIASGPENSSGALEGVITQLDHSVNELRRIARNMMPENLLKFGLETALRDLSESLSTPRTPVDFQAFGIEQHIPVSTQVTIYRIIQEALYNAVKHAHASSILLQCSQNGHVFFITLEDNGRGFDLNTQHDGTGLANIRNRVNYLQGRLDIVTAAGEGTTMNIELNVDHEPQDHFICC